MDYGFITAKSVTQPWEKAYGITAHAPRAFLVWSARSNG